MKTVAWAANILAALDDCPNGRVHSLFDHSLNLRFGERLVHVADGRYGRLPFGLILRGDDAQMLLRCLQPGETVYWDGHICFWGRGLAIALDGIQPYDLFLPEQQGTLPAGSKAALVDRLLAEKRASGLGFTAGDAVDHLDGKWCAKHSCLTDIRKAAAGLAPNLTDSIVRYFLGRGVGLTPGGDDFLVGFLAATWAAGKLQPNFINTFKSLVSAEGAHLTTDISAEYLYYAGQRQFASPLHDLMNALFVGDLPQITARADIILANGHTSGLDTLLGVLTAIYHL